MFEIFRKKRITKYTINASEYLEQVFTPEVPENTPQDDGVRYSLRGTRVTYNEADLKYGDSKTCDDTSVPGDKYDSRAVAAIMQKYNPNARSANFLAALDSNINKTFVDTLIIHISRKGLRDAQVYKAAQIDRRLFSKIMSDRYYKPSKDTAIAIAIALHLSLDEANDLLSRAGYAFSHSNKKDVIIEYFFREQIYDLNDINQVLFNLGQKYIGR